MNKNMLIYKGDRLEISYRRNDDGTNDGSIIKIPFEGHAYCIAKAPRYATDEEWKHNAEMMIKAISLYNVKVWDFE